MHLGEMRRGGPVVASRRPYPVRRAWQSGNKPPRIFMLRRIENGFRRAAFHNLPFMENADPVAESRDREKVMRDVKDGGSQFTV